MGGLGGCGAESHHGAGPPVQVLAASLGMSDVLPNTRPYVPRVGQVSPGGFEVLGWLWSRVGGHEAGCGVMGAMAQAVRHRYHPQSIMVAVGLWEAMGQAVGICEAGWRAVRQAVGH